MNAFRIAALLALSLTLALGAAACGEDETPAVADTGADVSEDVAVEDVEEEVTVEPGVTFVLENANPGGLPRYVQIVDRRGAPTWYNLMPVGSLDVYHRAESNCTLCSCDEPDCTPCEPVPEILKLEAGESVTARWDGTLIEIDSTNICESRIEPETDELQVEFAWSPEPPDADGNLPAGVVSRTRVRFNASTDDEVRYRIEAAE